MAALTWWDPGLAEIRSSFEEGEYDYRVSPSISVLLGVVDAAERLVQPGRSSTSGDVPVGAAEYMQLRRMFEP